jgi:hypothetical protein
MAGKTSLLAQSMTLDISGSSTFGRDPKIMSSRTFNMIISDNWLVEYGGYKSILQLLPEGNGRGIFTSIRGGLLVAVISNRVFSIQIYATTQQNERIYKTTQVGLLDSFSGDVFMDENNTNQIAICDQHDLYIYNHGVFSFEKAVLPEGLIPGYVTYQDGRFIIPDTASSVWALSQVGNGLDWFWGNSGGPVLGALQTKGDYVQAALRVPGKGNLLFVMGQTVTELWTDVGSAGFPYQKSKSINIDYGCINQATIASLDDLIVWLGINEKAGPVIMYSTGGNIEQISTDGINYKLSQLNHPEISTGFFVKLSGHLIYQLTFYDPSDNYSLIYDFTTQKFFDVTDENMNFHIARHVAFFDDDYYFISFNDGNLYQMDAAFTTYDYGLDSEGNPKIQEIPRVRVCSNIRAPNSSRFVVNSMNFVLEQGNDTANDFNDPSYNPRIGFSMSDNGGISFSGYMSYPLYNVGRRANKIDWWNLGSMNDFVAQFRFWGKGPWRCSNGEVNIYQ